MPPTIESTGGRFEPSEEFRPSPKLFYLVSALVVILCAAVSMIQYKKGWDDGAITAAFAQSWVDSGHIALTPLSPEVEGFSSLSWFLLLTVPRFLSHAPNVILIWMKLLSAGTFGASLMVFVRVARRFGFGAWEGALATLLLAFTTSPFHEAFNGMEMNLCMLLLLLFMDLLTSGMRTSRLLPLSWLLSFLLLATRFESPFLLLALFIGCVLARRTDNRIPRFGVMMWIGIGDGVLFFLFALWRHARFGLWMPNTIYAKLWPPYHADPGLRAALSIRSEALKELLIVFPALFAVAAGLMILSRLGKRTMEQTEHHRESVHPLLASVAAACVLFGVIFGRNWGYPGRMVLPMLPALLLVLLDRIFRYAPSRAALRNALVVVVVLQVAVWSVIAGHLMWAGDSIATARLEPEGLGAEAIRRDLHLQALTAMIPDVGGAGLCCERIRIVDSALLTNPYLAKNGYKVFVPYFHQESPQVVIMHGPWPWVTGAYASGVLDSYGILAFRNMRFFVRPDVYAALIRDADMHVRPVQESPVCYGPNPIDHDMAARRGTCLVLPDEMPPQN